MSADKQPRPSVLDVCLAIVGHPVENLVWRWNWKSAVTSSIIRGSIFFFANISAGFRAASGAMAVEFCLFATVSGFYGAITQGLRRAQPAWLASVVAMLFLPVLNHATEFLAHWLCGTPNLGRSLVVSISFTTISTLFNLFIMRRGVLIVGEGRRTLGDDLKAMPGLVAAFIALGPLFLWRFMRQRRGIAS